MRGMTGDSLTTLERGPASLGGLLDALSVRFEPLRPIGDDRFSAIVPLSDLGPSALSFIERGGQAPLKALLEAEGGLVLVERQWGEANRDAIATLAATPVLVDRPRLTVARILDRLKMEEELRFHGIHPTAVVAPGARLHPTVSVGPFCVIGSCEMGEGVRVLPFTFVDDPVTIGRRVTIREHCTIGTHSLGYARDEKDAWVRIPHIGHAVLEDDVDLFPYTVVDRGTLAETRVCRGAKVGCHAWISHNTRVGEDAMICGSVVLCGQSTVGARSWVGIGGILKQGVHVGADCMVGLGAVVLSDVPDGSVVAGVPARPVGEDRR